MDFNMWAVDNEKAINLENLKIYLDNDEDVEVLDNSSEAEYIEISYKGYLFRIDKNINILDYFEKGDIKREMITKSGEEGINGWYLSDVNLKIDVTSNKDQVKKIVYNINNGEDKQVNSNLVDITITDNGTNTIKYKLLDNSLNVVKENSVEVKINKNKPSAIIEISSFEKDYKEQIPVTITIQDDNISGIDNENCLWILNNSNEQIGNNKSAYTGGNIANIESLSVQDPGIYYLHCLITNNAGNYAEYISNPIKFIKITKLLNGAETHDDITAVSTKQKIDLTNVSEIICNWTYYADGGTNRYYLGIYDNPVSADINFTKNIYTESERNNVNEVKTLDVSNIKGEYYIKLVAHRYSGQYYTNHIQVNNLYMK